MSTTTANLGLFKYNTTTDANEAFNINTALNNNWDKIDLFSQNINVLPDQTSKSGYLLTTNGSEASWGNTVTTFPIVDYGADGYSWYKIYAKDFTGYRWCIQGSTYYKGSTIAGDNTITFIHEFNDLNYTMFINILHQTANGNFYAMYEKYLTRTSTTCTMYIGTAAFGYQWTACGYIKN